MVFESSPGMIFFIYSETIVIKLQYPFGVCVCRLVF